MNINLSNHLAIGFERPWRLIQNLANKNLDLLAGNVLRTAIRDAYATETKITGITSETGREEMRVVDKRLEWAIAKAKESIKKDYALDYEDGVLRVTPIDGGESIYFVRAQVVQAAPPEGLDHPTKILVFGAKEYIEGPQLTPYKALGRAGDLGGLVIADDPTRGDRGSTRAREFELNHNLYDAVVGFDAQKGDRINTQNRILANSLAVPHIAIGNQHSPSSVSAGIRPHNDRAVRFGSRTEIVDSLRDIILSGRFESNNVPEIKANKVKWMLPFGALTITKAHKLWS